MSVIAIEVPLPEPIVIRVTRYRCPFCRRSHSRRDGIRGHIKGCWHNPAARACGTCRHRDVYEDDDFECAAGLDPYVAETLTVADPGDARSGDVRTETRHHLVRGCPGWEARP